MPREIEVIVIDPYNQTVVRKVIEASLASYYQTIGEGCQNVEAIYPDCLNGECMYTDGEGKLGGQTAAFAIRTFEHDVLMGRAIILGTNNRGDSVSSRLHPERIMREIFRWYAPPEEEAA